MKKILALFIFLFFFQIIGVFAHEAGEQHSIFEWDSLQHILTFLIVVLVFIVGIYSLPKNSASPYLLAAILSLGLIHLTEIFVDSLQLLSMSESSLTAIEHLLTMLSLLLLGAGFYRMK